MKTLVFNKQANGKLHTESVDATLITKYMTNNLVSVSISSLAPYINITGRDLFKASALYIYLYKSQPTAEGDVYILNVAITTYKGQYVHTSSNIIKPINPEDITFAFSVTSTSLNKLYNMVNRIFITIPKDCFIEEECKNFLSKNNNSSQFKNINNKSVMYVQSDPTTKSTLWCTIKGTLIGSLVITDETLIKDVAEVKKKMQSTESVYLIVTVFKDDKINDKPYTVALSCYQKEPYIVTPSLYRTDVGHTLSKCINKLTYEQVMDTINSLITTVPCEFTELMRHNNAYDKTLQTPNVNESAATEDKLFEPTRWENS